MHPADEYAAIAAELRALKARQSRLRELMIADAGQRRSNQSEVVVQEKKRRVFVKDRLPPHIREDPAFWEVRVSPRVTVRSLDGPAGRRLSPEHDDPVLIEDG